LGSRKLERYSNFPTIPDTAVKVVASRSSSADIKVIVFVPISENLTFWNPMLQVALRPSKYHGRTTQNHLKKEFYREKETATCSSHRRCVVRHAVQPTCLAG
jgi:hypothetical protein